jgi:hypothetical protein
MTDLNSNLSEEFWEFWGANSESRLIIVGVGRTVRGDESTGLLITEELAKKSHRNVSD